MAISRPMGNVPAGASTSNPVTRLDLPAKPEAPPECGCCSLPEPRPENPDREKLRRLRLKTAIKKQEAILSGKLSVDKAPDYE